MRRTWTVGLLVLAGVATVGTGCATPRQRAEWARHSTHFASGEHMWFSLTNRDEKGAPHVTRGDLRTARAQSWWGDQVVVKPRQLSVK